MRLLCPQSTLLRHVRDGFISLEYYTALKMLIMLFSFLPQLNMGIILKKKFSWIWKMCEILIKPWNVDTITENLDLLHFKILQQPGNDSKTIIHICESFFSNNLPFCLIVVLMLNYFFLSLYLWILIANIGNGKERNLISPCGILFCQSQGVENTSH